MSKTITLHGAMQVVMCDVDLPEALIGSGDALGTHDAGGNEEPHWHWSIITIDVDNREVVDIDWGYHSKAEARHHMRMGDK